MAGLETDVSAEAESEYAAQAEQLKAEYEQKIADLKSRYPQLVARKLVEGLIKAGNGQRTIADLLGEVATMPIAVPSFPTVTTEASPTAPTSSGTSAPAAASGGVAVAEEEETLAMEPYIDSARCTACNECTNINKRMFAYNDKKQAYIKDPRAGSFKELVQAAERCTVRIIHPGTPLNPKEKDLDKWIKRAEPFN